LGAWELLVVDGGGRSPFEIRVKGKTIKTIWVGGSPGGRGIRGIRGVKPKVLISQVGGWLIWVAGEGTF